MLDLLICMQVTWGAVDEVAALSFLWFLCGLHIFWPFFALPFFPFPLVFHVMVLAISFYWIFWSNFLIRSFYWVSLQSSIILSDQVVSIFKLNPVNSLKQFRPNSLFHCLINVVTLASKNDIIAICLPMSYCMGNCNLPMNNVPPHKYYFHAFFSSYNTHLSILKFPWDGRASCCICISCLYIGYYWRFKENHCNPFWGD